MPRPPKVGASHDLIAVERWFVKRGVPHFHADYRGSTDVWTRALPILPLWFLGGALNGVNRRYGFWTNVGVAALGLLVMVIAVIVANIVRGQRPVFGRPNKIGPGELAVFALAPSIPPLLFGQQWVSAFWTVVAGVLLLAVIYFVTSYGLVPMTRWAVGRLVHQIAALGNLFVRALPLVLLFVTFLFINAEVWQVAGLLYGLAFPLVLGTFFALGAVFVLSRLPQDVKAIGHFDSWDEVRSLVAETPASTLAIPERGVPEPDPASWREWLNVGLVMLFSRAVQITLVAALIGAFFVGFGVVGIPASTIAVWTGAEPNVLATFTLTGRELVLTEQLLRVAAFLASFTGLYFTVYLVTDDTYRSEFQEDVVSEVRTAFAVRALYRSNCS